MTDRLDQQIDAQLDRLGWGVSDDNPPEEAGCLACWNTATTGTDGLVTLHDNQDVVTVCDGAVLLAVLQTLPEDVAWDDLWHAILPTVREA